MTSWKKLLKSLGFTESEATLYLVSLELGPASVQDLAKKAGVSRVTTYTVIEALMKDGLMSTVQKGKKQHFVAEAPERLISFMNHKMKNMEATLHEVTGSLHELKLIQRGEKPVVKMFEGEEAFNALHEDMIKTQPKEIDEFCNLDDLRKMFTTENLVTHGNKLNRFKPKARMIYTSKTKDVETVNENMTSQRIHGEEEFHGDVVVYDSKVAISSFGQKPITAIIESRTIADTFRALFNNYWKQLKK